MLPAGARVRRRDEFAHVMRGRRARASGVIVHATQTSPVGHTAAPARAGVIVGKAVGPAVVRNRVRRRLRHQLAPLIDSLPSGSLIVVRALPTAASMTSPQLSSSLGAAIRRLPDGTL